MRFIPLGVAVLIFLLVGVLPQVRFRRRYGHSPIAASGSVQWISRTFVTVAVLQSFIWPAAGQTMRALLLFRPQPIPGFVVLVIGLVTIVRAQWEMGASWRIGIDLASRPGLITEGLYRFSRNPIYAGILLMVLGYVLAVPTAISLVLLVFVAVAFSFHVRAEERYLVAAYGDEFKGYAARVGRFLPGIGLLR